MAFSSITVGANSTSWDWGVYNGSKLTQRFTVTENASYTSGDGSGLMPVEFESLTLRLGNPNYSAQAEASVVFFIADNNTASTARVESSGYTLTTAMTNVNKTINKYASVNASVTKYFGFRITNSGYGNQALGTGGAAADITRVNSDGTTSSYKWGSSTATWDANKLYGIVYYNVCPSAPGTISAGTRTSSDIPLTWLNCANDGHGLTANDNVNGFRVEYKASSSATWILAKADTGTATKSFSPASFVTLNPGTSYDFRIAALNDVTTGASGQVVGSRTIRYGQFTTLSGVYTLPTWANTSFPSGTSGVSYTYTYTANGESVSYGTPTSQSWTDVNGNVTAGLIPGLSFTGNTLSGTPQRAGTQNFTIQATTGTDTITQAISITFENAKPVMFSSPTTRARATSLKYWDGSAWQNATKIRVWDGTKWVDLNGSPPT